MDDRQPSEDPPSSASSDSTNSDEAVQCQPDDQFSEPSTVPRTQKIRPRTRSYSKSKAGASEMALLHTSSRRTIYMAGRPPWYNCQGQLTEAYVIGLCGGSASGKTTVAKKIIEALDVPWVSLLSMDSFYKDLTIEQQKLASENKYNFDHPGSFDFDLIVETVRKLKEGKHVEVPVYNFTTHNREKQWKNVYGANVVIFEGIFSFYSKALNEMMDIRVFVDTDADIRLARRLRRDIAERGRDLCGVLEQYATYVKPAFENFIEPLMAHADIIVPRGAENHIALNLIVQHVSTQLEKRGLQLRPQLALSNAAGEPLPSSLHILDPAPQVLGLHTFIRNKNISRDEFIFYSKRLMRLVMEYAMSFLPFNTVTVQTPQGNSYVGKRLDNSRDICGVSILRAGETMEPALCEVVKDVKLGKILIQTNEDTEEPELFYLRLPKGMSRYRVMLMDVTVATGAAAMMAIRVLLDHDVPQENIILLSLIMAESGVHSIAYAFPKVKIITTAVDPEVNEFYHIIPGIGNFGDRYFGTDGVGMKVDDNNVTGLTGL